MGLKHRYLFSRPGKFGENEVPFLRLGMYGKTNSFTIFSPDFEKCEFHNYSQQIISLQKVDLERGGKKWKAK